MFGLTLSTILCVGFVSALFEDGMEYEDLTAVDKDDLGGGSYDSPKQKQIVVVKRGFKGKS